MKWNSNELTFEQGLKRIKELNKHMAVAEGYYQQRRSQGALPNCNKA